MLLSGSVVGSSAAGFGKIRGTIHPVQDDEEETPCDDDEEVAEDANATAAAVLGSVMKK